MARLRLLCVAAAAVSSNGQQMLSDCNGNLQPQGTIGDGHCNPGSDDVSDAGREAMIHALRTSGVLSAAEAAALGTHVASAPDSPAREYVDAPSPNWWVRNGTLILSASAQ